MRLHRLELQAFGPFASPQAIDFDRLTTSGLFLLEGPTGSGKSTILDAITFALYGELSATSSNKDRFHSDFAGPDVPPSVTMEFSVGGSRYRIERTPSYERPKLRGDGVTTEKPSIHLQRHDGDGWTSLATSVHEAASSIIEIVGLNAEQFTQVALLPQGEFARFLRASDDERSVLLTKLFSAHLYGTIMKGLQELAQDANRGLADADEGILTASAAALEAAGSEGDVHEQLAGLSRSERDLRFAEIAEQLESTLGQATIDKTEGTAAAEQAALELSRAEQASVRMAKLVELRRAHDEHEESRGEHELRAARLEIARRAEPVRPLIDALSEADALVRATRGTLLDLDIDPSEDMLDGLGGEEYAASSTALRSEADRLQHLVTTELALPTMKEAHRSLVAEHDAARTSLVQLDEERKKLPDALADLSNRREAAARLAASLGESTVTLEATTTKLRAAERRDRLLPLLDEAEIAKTVAKDAHQASIDEYQRLQQSRLEGMRAELAHELVDGHECPVCGSLEHPKPAAAVGAAVSKSDVDAARRAAESAAQASIAGSAAWDALVAEQIAARAVAGDDGVDQLDRARTALAEEVQQASQAASQIDVIDESLTTINANTAAIEAGLLAATEEVARLHERVRRSAEVLEESRGAVRAARAEFESVSARQHSLMAQADTAASIAAALEAITSAMAAAERARSRAERAARDCGFAGLADVHELRADPGELADLEKLVQAWNEDTVRIGAALADPELKGLDPAQSDEVDAVLDNAKARLAGAKREEERLQFALAAAQRSHDRFTARLQDVREAVAELERLAESSATVIRLDRLARGMEGHRRVELKAYVLRRWFERVVGAANLRLTTMSSGRYELQRVDESSGRANARTGLTLLVVDRHTGKSRSPESLSGGESFFTSLSLALGLADVVKSEAGGVDLDTLFIDEGFGTLDAETLDHVMAVIDELRDRGRVVGIVSHVAELKDRVPERLEVRRNPDGSSCVRVVA